MGFLYHAIKLPQAITLTFFLSLFNHFKFLFIGAITRLGLYKPPPEEEEAQDPRDNYILVLDPSCPSVVPISVYIVTAIIKKKLKIIQYRDFVFLGQQKEGEKVCTICLECVELSHEIRDLCKCGHVFHRECLDTWIDQGQVNCPLCRSMLLTPKEILANRFSSHETVSLGPTSS